MKVILDPGHSLIKGDRGTEQNDIVEGVWVRQFARDLLQRHPGKFAVLTGSPMARFSFTERARQSKQLIEAGEALPLVLVLHINSGPSRGAQAYYLDSQPHMKAVGGAWLKSLPDTLRKDRIARSAERKNGDPKWDYLDNCKNTIKRHTLHADALLLELFYASWPPDVIAVKDPTTYSQLLKSVVGLVNTWRAYKDVQCQS